MAGELTRRDFLREASGAGVVLSLLAQADNLSAQVAAADGGKNFSGIFAILSSPFTLNDQLDEEDLEREVDFCVRAGAHGVVWPQLASEFYVLSENEQRRGAERRLSSRQHRERSR